MTADQAGFFAFVIFFTALLAEFGAFDWLVLHEEAVARDQWVADGEPMRYLWSRGRWTPSRQFARDRLAFRLLWRTPSWAESNPAASRALTIMRVASVAALVAWIVMMLSLLGPMLRATSG